MKVIEIECPYCTKENENCSHCNNFKKRIALIDNKHTWLLQIQKVNCEFCDEGKVENTSYIYKKTIFTKKNYRIKNESYNNCIRCFGIGFRLKKITQYLCPECEGVGSILFYKEKKPFLPFFKIREYEEYENCKKCKGNKYIEKYSSEFYIGTNDKTFVLN
ncbi:hypothetical protein [Arcobacter roscoffensis]|uniref:Uncharacterized protein n=1 Tax=Arcobacter roscoffensis TaxID=2961520 RepID=A0ABY5E0E9_9BACT|nr:hypothetical protein [Arcobacter roscoffensis]UTJ05687.1 hypothetical protein NJU99_10490 [Arcobacter roscoffensis]